MTTESSHAGEGPAPLRGKRVLVTGAAVRVGRSIALAFARAGADVAVHYRGSAAAARATADEIRGLGVRAVLIQADQALPGGPERLVAEAAGALGGLDAAVLSAARFEKVPAAELDRARFEAMLTANLTGPFLVARAAYPHLRASRGAIVTVLDLCGTSQVWKGYAHYAAAKAGLAALTRLLALEWAPEVRVNGIAPGTVLAPADTAPEERERLVRRIPLGREGDPSDVARTAVFLAGEPFITGQILAVDGGRSILP
ncbi:MAG: pteridine reductase [Myxococcales bacterium]